MSSARIDDVILTAWETWRECKAAYQALQVGRSDDYTPEEHKLFAKIDGAEIVIRYCKAHTPQGVIAQLLVALHHINTDSEVETALISNDMGSIFAMDPSLDWPDRLILAAIRSLQSMGARP